MTQTRRLSYVLFLNIGMIAGLIIVGRTSHSLGVLAAAGDFVADSFAIVLGLVAVYLRDIHSKRQAPTYVALMNGLLLLLVTVFVLSHATSRLLTHSPQINGLPVLVISIISAVVMVTGAFIIGRGAGSEDLHMRSVLLDTLSDALSALAVAIVGGIIYFTHGLYWLDAVVAAIISLVVGFGALRLLRDVVKALRHPAT